MKNQRFLSVIICLALMLTLLPAISGIASAAWVEDVYIGGTELADGESASFGSGTASYSASTGVLTLENVTVTGDSRFAAIQVEGDVIIELVGTNTVTAYKDRGVGVYVKGALTVRSQTGSNTDTLTVTCGVQRSVACTGVHVGGKLTISSGSLTGVGVDNATYSLESYGVRADSIEVTGGSLTGTGKLTKGASYGVYATSAITVSGGSISGTGGTAGGVNMSCGVYSGGSVKASGGSLSGTGATMSSSYNKSYGVYAASAIKVSDAGSINGTGVATKESSYGVFSNDTITVTGGGLSGTCEAQGYNTYGVYATGKLTVSGGTLTGDGAENAARLSYGVSAGSIELSETGSIIGTGKPATIESGISSYGVSCSSITVTGGNLTATGSDISGTQAFSFGIYTGSITVSGGVVTATGGNATATDNEANSAGIRATSGGITVSGGSVTATSGTVAGITSASSPGIYASPINISGGSVTASSGDNKEDNWALYTRPTLSYPYSVNYRYRTNTAATQPTGPYTRSRVTQYTHSGIKYFEIIPDPSVATIDEVTISGTEDTELISGQTVTIRLTEDTFKEIAAGSVTWMTNLPAGLTQSLAAVTAGDTAATITISGTPAAASGALLNITIPAEALTSNAILPVNSNEAAKLAIAPVVPTLDSRTASSITLTYTDGYEYRMDDNAWQYFGEFSDLRPATSYTFYQRVKAAAGGVPASAVSASVTIYTLPTTPDAVTAEDLVAAANTISIKAGESVTTNEYAVTSYSATSAPTEGWVDGTGTEGAALSLSAEALTAATQYKVWVRVKAVEDGAPASVAVSTAVYTLPTTPTVPTLDSRTANSITLTYTDGYEYRMDDNVWQAYAEFSDLAPAQSYTFYQRVKAAAGGAPASAVSASVAIYTLPTTPEAVTAEDLVAAATSISIKAGASVAANEYAVTLNTVETAPTSGWVDGTDAELVVASSLTAATQYNVWVRVKAIDGDAPASVAVITPVYTLAATPTAADFTVTQPTASSGENSKGAVVVAAGKTASDYEYRIKTDGVWPDGWTNLGTTPLSAIDAPATIELRLKLTHDPTIPESAAYTVTINKFAPPSNNSGGGGGGAPVVPTTPAATVVIGNSTQNIATVETTTNTDGTKDTTVKVDGAKMNTQLAGAAAGTDVKVTVPKTDGAATAQLVVKNVDDMAQKEMTLSVQVEGISYDLPAVAVDTASLLKELGASDPEKVPVNVTIAQLTENDVNLEEGELVLPPVEFTVTASYGGRNTEIDVFEKYVQRVIEVPNSEDAGKITTAVVVENGKQRHVPTEVFSGDGKWYARINSLTNSTYALISNEKSFSDASGKWFEDVVTEMASRGVINGKAEGVFDGDGSITRAEFAAIIVRAMGLPTDGECDFTDVKAGDWCYGSVGTAVKFGLVKGYDDGSFKPNANITRQEAMALIQRAAQLADFSSGNVSVQGFADLESVGAWALGAVNFNVANGLIVGSGGYIRPTDNITRAESATVVLRLLQKAQLVDVRAKA